MTIQDKIQKMVDEHDIVLFMKGSADFPQCGFSSVVAQIMKYLETPFLDVNVLEDPEIRQGIKEYGQWPTIPQLYVNTELLGGSDIMMEMFESGELQKAIQPK